MPQQASERSALLRSGVCHLRDHLGSSGVIVDGSGNVAKREFYYPFGGNRGSAFSDLTTKRFTGQYHEQGLPGGEGLSYYNARWYDAQLGRFVSADTIVPEPGNPQAYNRYTYVVNNPLKFIDPSGHAYCIDGDCATLQNPVTGGTIHRSGKSANAAKASTNTRNHTAYVPIYGPQPPRTAPPTSGPSASWNPCPGHFLCQAQQEMPYSGGPGSAPRSATPAPGPWLSPGSTPTPTPGTYFGQGQPLPSATTSVPIQPAQTSDYVSAAHGELLERTLGIGIANLTQFGSGATMVRAFGRTAPPVIGLVISVAPNMIGNIRTGHGPGTAKFYADAVADSLGYLAAAGGGKLLGVASTFVTTQPYVGPVAEIVGVIGISVQWDTRLAPRLSQWIESKLSR